MKLYALTISLLVVAPVSAFAQYSESIQMTRYWQDDRCWCSIATLEMWSDYVNQSPWNSSRQSQLASTYGVAAYSNGCSTNGLSAPDLANALEDQTSNWFSHYEESSQNSVASTIVSEIHASKPMAIVGYTRYTNGTTTANQHYYLVVAFRNTGSSYSNNSSSISGFWMNDPVYGASGSRYANIQATSPTTFISKSIFFSTYASQRQCNPVLSSMCYNGVRD